VKIISWNVAGYRACIKKGFIDFFEDEQADVFCLQEVKATEVQIPYHPEGYFCYLNEADKKGYSGTLIYTKVRPESVTFGIGIGEHDHEGRVITLELNNFYLVNVYVPNAKRGLERLDYRVQWEKDFLSYLKQLERNKPVVVCGDFNVAHREIDLRNPKQNIGNAGFTHEERECFTNLLNAGFIDTYRYFYPSKEAYTWWSYMSAARDRNIGWRIDYFIVSKPFISHVKDSIIYSNVLGSDHCPVGLILK
jgi:exodeoxyribonuclease III